MRIFLTLNPSTNSAVPNNLIWYHNLYEPLIDLGHDVFLLRIDLAAQQLGVQRRTKKFQAGFCQLLLDLFNSENSKKPFDFFLSYLIDSEITVECLKEIKKTGVPIANFSCNNIHQFYLTEKIAPYFDYNLHSEKHAAEKFKSIGANPVWFQMAANPNYYYPINVERNNDVVFIGGAYAKRAYYLWNLLENGIDVQIFGPIWLYSDKLAALRRIKREFRRLAKIFKIIYTFNPAERAQISYEVADLDFLENMMIKYESHLHFSLSDQAMIQKYSESKINLGFLEVYDDHDHAKTSLQHLHLREFEVPMCRGLYFTNYSDELAEFYEPDKEVVVFRNEHELISKAKYYLSHQIEAEKIREAGYIRAIKCHTYHKRFTELFEKINII